MATSPLTNQPADGQEADRSKERLLQPGQMFGQYKIIKMISACGAGEVYLAKHAVSGKEYALKVYSPIVSLTDSGFDSRFHEITKKLKSHIHPGIAGTHAAGCENDHYYIAMEHVESAGGPRTLEDMMRGKARLPEFQAKKIILNLCASLMSLHTRKDHPTVHTNLKPANILIDKNNRILLSDIGSVSILGIDYYRELFKYAVSQSAAAMPAAEVAANAKADLDRTMSVLFLQDWRFKTKISFAARPLKTILGKIFKPMLPKKDQAEAGNGKTKNDKTLPDDIRSAIETYDYMSPEQKAGEEPTEKSNIYSAGLILYRMLTGKKLGGCWTMPSDAGLAPEWDYILLRCLQSEPDERYSSIAEFEEAVSRVNAKEKKSLMLPLVSAAILSLVVISFLAFYYSSISSDGKSQDSGWRRLFFKRAPKNSAALAAGTMVFYKVTTPLENVSLKIYDGDKIAEDVKTVGPEGAVIPLKTGIYRAVAEKYGYETFSRDIFVSEKENSLNIEMEKIKTLQVKQYIYMQGLKSPAEGFPWIIPKLDMEFLPVEPGTFLFGCARRDKAEGDKNDLPQRSCSIEKTFWIAKTEVTQSQYEEIMPSNPSLFKRSGPSAPAENITYKNALDFCAKLTQKENNLGRLPDGYVYRLPTEEEWEYCCRAGSEANYCFGDNKSILSEFAWYENNSQRVTHGSGMKNPNTRGIYDMHGNTSEWCLPAAETALRGDGKKIQAVSRGGSWANFAKDARCVSRVIFLNDSYCDSTTGFRAVLAPPLKEEE